jgi:hypothetical protein
MKCMPEAQAITATEQLQKWRTEQHASMQVTKMQHSLLWKYTALYICHTSQKSSN